MTTSAEWKGRVGEVWAEEVTALDPMLDQIGQHAMESMGDIAEKRVLDLGCGAGQTVAQLIARGAKVTGADISPDLIGFAKDRLADQAKFVLGDAGNMDLNGPYDHLYSRFGAMFFDAPVAAYSHIRDQVGADCHLTIACWADRMDNEWVTLPMSAARGLIPKSSRPAAGTPGPFGWEDPATFEPILAQSGWKNLSWHPVTVQVPISMGDNPDPVERAIVFVQRIGPLAGGMKDLEREAKEQLRDKLRDEFHKKLDGDMVALTGKAWIIKGQS